MAADDDEELTVDDLDDLEAESQEEGEAGEDDDGSSSENPPWGPTIVVNNTTYAVSLFWQPLQDQNDPYPEVKETVENFMTGADLFCLRSGTAPQYAIGNSTEGHKAGMPSAAAAIAEKFQDKPSSVAVFEVDEGWWFIAIRNDLILSEEDILYLNEEDAKKAFFAMMAVPDWGRKIAPDSWDIDGTEEVDLWDILTSPGSSKLMRINKTDKKTKMAIAAVGLVVLYIGFKLISGLFGTKAPAPVIKPLIPLPAVEEEEAPPPQQEVIVYPWEHLVDYKEFLNRCHAAVSQLKTIVIPGWALNAVSCTPGGTTATWQPTWGDVGWAKRAFEEYNIRGLDFLIDSGTVIATLNMGDIPERSDTPQLGGSDIQEELSGIFQTIKMQASIQEIQPEIKVQNTENGLGTEVVTTRVWPRVMLNFTSELPMENWFQLFDSFPALEILQIHYDPVNNLWSYEVQIYEPTV